MAKYVLVSDTTLSHDYRNFPLLDFLPSAPTSFVPSSIYGYLKGRPPKPSADGRAVFATYPLRKLEAALLSEYGPEDVVVAHEDHVADFVDDDTELIGVTTMDPLGLAPLTMSYSIFFGTDAPAYVAREFVQLMKEVNSARAGKKAKLVVGGPGVWELTIRPEELDNLGIDYAYQGECDDIVPELFDYLVNGTSPQNGFYKGFQTFDNNFHKQWIGDERFVTRYQFAKQYPKLEDIPTIVNPSIKGMTECMRGCGIGCDFCEVTLRPLRYYPPMMVRKELEVNVRAGINHAWLHSDEIFAYDHGRNFVPNYESLSELLTTVMETKGIEHMNPTHGRISIPAAYPDLMRKLSQIIKASDDNWIGLQVGVETGSNTLAKKHMPNKTLPLKIGPDGTWPDIVWQGTYVMNKYYWRPAFTVQVGQDGETDEDNWDTVALINSMSNSTLDDGKPFEFTITPMQNVPLGLIKNRAFSSITLNDSQLAVYYASYRHLAKLASRDAFRKGRSGRDPSVFSRVGTGTLISLGGRAMLRFVANMCRKRGLDLDKAARYGIERKTPQAPMVVAM